MTVMIISELGRRIVSSMFELRSRLTSAVEPSSANPKVASFIPGPVSLMMIRYVACIILLEWSTTSLGLWVYRITVPHAQYDILILNSNTLSQDHVQYHQHELNKLLIKTMKHKK